jgi:PAS domain S-box-containing protein
MPPGDANDLRVDEPLGAGLSARHLFAIFESAPIPQLLIRPNDPDFTLLAASDAYLRISGLSRDRIIWQKLSEVFPRCIENLASLRRVTANQLPDQLPATEGSVFGQRVWKARNTPVLDENGRVAYILHTLEEVTAKVRAEKKAEAAEKRFRQVVEASALGILIGDSEGAVSYANPALLNLIGYNEDDVAAGRVRWDQLTPPEYAPLDTEARRQLRATGVCQPYEKVYMAQSGRRVPILMAASFLEPRNGLTQAAAFVVDLTERKQSQRDAFLVQLDDAMRPFDDPGGNCRRRTQDALRIPEGGSLLKLGLRTG